MHREFDGFNKRLLELERIVFSALPSSVSTSPWVGEENLVISDSQRKKPTITIPDAAGSLSFDGSTQIHQAEIQFDAVTTLNTSTGSVEFYGSTSILALARSLDNRLREFEGEHRGFQTLLKKSRTTTRGLEVDLEGLFEHNDFVPAAWQPGNRWQLRKDVADGHVQSFFNTIHDYLPVLDVDVFMAAYRQFWAAPPADVECVAARQAECLIYSVLAMGALYSDSGSDNAESAASYFSRAQDLLGRLFDAVSVETVQAALFIVRLVILHFPCLVRDGADKVFLRAAMLSTQ